MDFFAVVAFFKRRLQQLRWPFGFALCDRRDSAACTRASDVKLALLGNSLEGFQRLIVGFEFDIGGAEIITRAIVFRVAGKNQIEFGGGAVEVALLKRNQTDLDPGVARIGFAAFQALELAQRFIELILPDIEFAQAAARPNMLRD